MAEGVAVEKYQLLRIKVVFRDFNSLLLRYTTPPRLLVTCHYVRATFLPESFSFQTRSLISRGKVCENLKENYKFAWHHTVDARQITLQETYLH